MFEKCKNSFKLSYLYLTGREWQWHPMDFSLLEEDTRSNEEKQQKFDEVLQSIPESARNNFTRMYVAVCLAIFSLFVLCFI